MTGRILIIGMFAIALAFGAGLYYSQVYAWYEEVSLEEAGGVQVLDRVTGEAIAVPVSAFEAIDAETSPIRFRACFRTETQAADLDAARPAPEAVPLTAPNWFDCFDAADIGALLEAGEARAWVARTNEPYGFDRVLAVAGDGRGWIWSQINACGAAVYDGEVPPEGCPPAPPEFR